MFKVRYYIHPTGLICRFKISTMIHMDWSLYSFWSLRSLVPWSVPNRNGSITISPDSMPVFLFKAIPPVQPEMYDTVSSFFSSDVVVSSPIPMKRTVHHVLRPRCVWWLVDCCVLNGDRTPWHGRYYPSGTHNTCIFVTKLYCINILGPLTSVIGQTWTT